MNAPTPTSSAAPRKFIKELAENEKIDQVFLLHEKQLQEYDIKIKTAFAEALPQINASKDQLRQVFLN